MFSHTTTVLQIVDNCVRHIILCLRHLVAITYRLTYKFEVNTRSQTLVDTSIVLLDGNTIENCWLKLNHCSYVLNGVLCDTCKTTSPGSVVYRLPLLSIIL